MFCRDLKALSVVKIEGGGRGIETIINDVFGRFWWVLCAPQDKLRLASSQIFLAA
jgi:hypothetical protein